MNEPDSDSGVIMRMEKVLGSKLAMVSGWGTGFALLFALLNRHVAWNDAKLALLDTALSVAVAVFFLLTVSAFATGLAGVRKNLESNDVAEKHKAFIGLLFISVIMLGGWFFLERAPELYGKTRTATTLGTLMLGSGIILIWTGIPKLMKKE